MMGSMVEVAREVETTSCGALEKLVFQVYQLSLAV